MGGVWELGLSLVPWLRFRRLTAGVLGVLAWCRASQALLLLKEVVLPL